MKPPSTSSARRGADTMSEGDRRLVAHLEQAETEALLSVPAETVVKLVRRRAEHGGALRLHRLTIIGDLDIHDLASPDLALSLDRVTIDGGLMMERAVLASLDIIDSRMARASLDDVSMRFVRCAGLQLAGHLSLASARLERLKIERSRLRGALFLRDANVRRDIVLAHSRAGTGKVALQADGLEVGHSLDFRDGVRMDGPVELDAVRIRDLIISRGAHLERLSLRRAHLGMIRADVGARIDRGLAAANLEVEGEVRLGAAFRADADGLALQLRETRLGGDLRLEEGFQAEGTLQLSGVEARGHVLLAGVVEARERSALDVSRLSCARLAVEFQRTVGGVSLRQTRCSGLVLTGDHEGEPSAPLHLGLTCSGRAVIGGGGAKIRGALSLIGLACEELDLGDIEIVAHAEGPWRGVAVAARHMKVATVTRFGRPSGATRLQGLVALDHARMGDAVRFHDTIIAGACTALEGCSEPTALSMRQARCSGDLNLGGVVADSRIDLTGLECEGDLTLTGLTLSAAEPSRIDLAKVRIGGGLIVRGLRLSGPWRIDAEGLEATRLDDDGGEAWGGAHVRAVGMRYAELAELHGSGDVGLGVRRRLAWLDDNARADHQSGLGFNPRPYRTFMAVLTAAGLSEDAKRVETTALRRERRWGGGDRLRRLGGGLLDLVSGYGHSPARATMALAAYFLIGWGGVTLADRAGAFETSPFIDGLVLEANRAAAPTGCPWLEPPLYALDLIVPLTTLGTESFCTVRASHRPWIWAMVAYRLFGWILISIAVLTYSGILRRDRPDL